MSSRRSSATLSSARLTHRCLLAAPLGIALLASGTMAHAKTDSTVPDWVSTAAGTQFPKLPSDTKAVVLLDSTRLTVTPDGHAIEHHRRVLRILRPAGRDDATVYLPFSSTEPLSNIHIWSIGPDGHQYAVKDKEIGEMGYPGGGNLYDDIRIRYATAPGSDPGGVVAVEYEQKVPNYLNEVIWEFQSDLPAVNTSYSVTLPPGFSYTTSFAHHTAVKPTDLEHGETRWNLSNVPAIDLHDLSFTPREVALAGRMSLHFNGPGVAAVGDTWSGIGSWYSHLSSDRLAPTPEISSKAVELAGSSPDFYTRVEPIAEFVQKGIRYFVIERGIGGHQPHPAAEIYKNKFGDCKDKATLLVSMLSAVGVHADLLLVDTRRGAMDPEAPSIFGNHMIAAIEIPDGYTSPRLRSVVTLKSGKRLLIFDPTWEETPFGQLEHNLQGSYGLLADGATSQIIPLPVLSPDLNRVQRSATFQLSADGTLQGSVTEKRFGDSAESTRHRLSSSTERDQARALDNALSQDLSQFAVSGLQYSNATALNKDLTTTYSLSAEHFAKSAGPLLMVRPRVLGSENILRLLHDRSDREGGTGRELPFDLNATLEQRDDFQIELPTGYTADELPDAVTLDLGFASYQSSTRLDGHTLHFTRTYTVREVTVGADHEKDLQKLATTIASDEQSTAVLKKL